MSASPVVRQAVTVLSDVSLALEFGSGLRFYFNERFAARIELEGFKLTSLPSSLEPNLCCFAVGSVFQPR
jgi:hypothetical protein